MQLYDDILVRCRVSRFLWERKYPQDQKDTSRQAAQIVQRPGVHMATYGGLSSEIARLEVWGPEQEA